MDNTGDLTVLLGSRHPLLLVDSDDETRLLDMLRRGARALGLSLWVWSATGGLAREGRDPQYATLRPEAALQFIGELRQPGVFVFADAHPYLEDAMVVRTLKERAQATAEGQTIVVTGPGIEVPPELATLARRWRLQPPQPTEIADLLDRTLYDLKARGITVEVTEQQRRAMVSALSGLSIAEAERLIQQAASTGGGVTGADVVGLQNAKAQLLTADGILELIEADHGTLSDVGGFDRLKDWLELRARDRRDTAAAMGLEPPRGVLLTGVPGCGKSLAAKAVARTWEIPLVLLDPARLYSKYLGESEQRLADALEAVDLLSPAVLWIDEIEKGFATGGDGDGGVSRRLLGTFLRWMQDRQSDVFLIATANDVSALPPELLRKGRFDEVFFVDLPDEKARVAILDTHLRRRNQDPDAFDLAGLAAATDGFSGAELETSVVGALYRALEADSPLSQAMLEIELGATVPLSVARREDVDALRAWARERAIAA